MIIFQKRSVALITLFGFLTPFFWFLFEFEFFTAPNSAGLRLIQWVAVISCPPLLLQPYINLTAWFLAPFLNAVLYYVVARLVNNTSLRYRHA